MKTKYIILAILAYLLIACAPGDPGATPTPTITPTPAPTPTETSVPCRHLAQAYLDQALPLEQEYKDTIRTASNTARIALSPVIMNLQETRRKLQSIQYSGCAFNIADSMIAEMTNAIDGLNAFMGKESDATQKAYFDKATFYSEAITKELGKFNNNQSPYDK